MLPLEKRLDAAIPRVTLGRFPTPVESHPELARQMGFGTLSIKREDKNALDGPGGNKLRALEWILPRAGSWIVSMGGYGSTYVAALSFYAQRRGQNVAVGLFPQPWVGSVPGTLAATESHARVFLAEAKWKLPFAVIQAWRHASRFGRPSWVPAGGANPLGVLGGVNAALEFWEQVTAGEVAKPDVIVAPLGSGGTIAGLLLGSWIAGADVTLCGVRVADPIVANRWQVNRLVASTRRLLSNSGLEVRPGSARVRVLTDFLGRGYGSPTPAARAAARRVSGFNLALEQTYGAKSFAALDALRGSYHAPCFWNTFDPQIAIVPEDTPLLRRARVTAECLWPHPTLI
jgi:D-cysteine desulfhydrase